MDGREKKQIKKKKKIKQSKNKILLFEVKQKKP